MNVLIDRLRGLWARKFVRDTLALQISKITVAGLSALSAILVFRLMGPAAFGIYGLAQSFLGLFSALDFTGIGVLTTTRLGIAIGEKNADEIHNLLGYYVKISLLFHLGLAALVALAGPALSLLIQGDARPGQLAAWLAAAGIADGLYLMVPIALQSRRSMKTLSLLQVANQIVLSLCMAGAVLIEPSAESLIAARLVYSISTLLLAYGVYWQQRAITSVTFPPLRAVFARAWRVSPRPYWRWGVANAIDRSLAQLFQQIPMQVAGAFGGPAAAGFLDLALSGLSQASIVTSAIFDNMQAVVPQAVGRRDYVRLWRDFRRIALILGLGGLIFYAGVALAAPLLVPLVVGARWIDAIPVVAALAPFGAITTIGGIFAPVYRAFAIVRWIIVTKLLSLAIGVPLGIGITAWLSGRAAAPSAWLGADALTASNVSQAAAIGGALMISLLYAVSVATMAGIVLPLMKRRAEGELQRGAEGYFA